MSSIMEIQAQMMQDAFGRLASIDRFKEDFKDQLGGIEVKFDRFSDACEFVYICDFMMRYCEEAQKYLDDYTDWLFENGDKMNEGLYLEQMNLCKKAKEFSQANEDYNHFLIQAGIASQYLNKKGKKLAKKNKPVKWNKLEAFITMAKGRPDTPIEDFFEELKFISYSKIDITFDENVKYVRDIDTTMYRQTH